MTRVEQSSLGPAAAGSPSVRTPPGGPFLADRFLLRQKFLTISESYRVFNAAGVPILFVQRHAHLGKQFLALLGFLGCAGAMVLVGYGVGSAVGTEAGMVIGVLAGAFLGVGGGIAAAIAIFPKRHIEFFADEGKSRLLMRIYQDHKWSFLHTTYTAADESDQLLGWYSKSNLSNMFRKEWKIFQSRRGARVHGRRGFVVHGVRAAMGSEDADALHPAWAA